MGEQRERLPGSGRTGWSVLGYAAVGVVAAVTLADGLDRVDLVVLSACAVLAVSVRLFLHRPLAEVDDEHLHLRNALSTVRIPLAAVERVAVGRFLAVVAGERRYVSPSVQRSLAAVTRGPRRAADPVDGRAPSVDEADLVEHRIAQLAEQARERAGVAMLSDEQLALAGGVERRWSVEGIALLAGSVVLLVLAVALT